MEVIFQITCCRFALVIFAYKENFHLHTMACGGLREVREALIVANAEEIIDDEDLVYLYDTFCSRPVYPYLYQIGERRSLSL